MTSNSLDIDGNAKDSKTAGAAAFDWVQVQYSWKNWSLQNKTIHRWSSRSVILEPYIIPFNRRALWQANYIQVSVD